MPRKADPTTQTIGPYRLQPRARSGGQVWRILWQEGGRQREHTEPDEDAAKLWCAKHLVAADVAGRPGAALSPDTPLWIIMGAWSDPAQHGDWRSTATVSSYTGLMRRHLLPPLGQLTARQLSAGAMNAALIAARDKGLAQRTVQDIHGTLRHFVRWAHAQGCWDQWARPFEGVALPRGVRVAKINETIDRKAEVPTAAQVAALADGLAVLGRRSRERRHRAPAPVDGDLLARLAASSGLRWGELIALKPVDVGAKKRTLAVVRQIREVDGKLEAAHCTPCGRYVPCWAEDGVSCPVCGSEVQDVLPKHEKTRATVFGVDVEDELRALVEAAPHGRALLFKPPMSPVLRRSVFARSFRAARAASDYPDHLDWHALRHYFCTSMLDRGIRAATVSALAGHHSVTFTLSRYVGADEDYLDEALGA